MTKKRKITPAERDEFLKGLNEDFAHLKEDPAAWQEELDERALRDAASDADNAKVLEREEIEEDVYWAALIATRDTPDAVWVSHEEAWFPSIMSQGFEDLRRNPAAWGEDVIPRGDLVEFHGYTMSVDKFQQAIRDYLSTVTPAVAEEFMESNRQWLRQQVQAGLDDIEAGRFRDGPPVMAEIHQRLLDMKARQDAPTEHETTLSNRDRDMVLALLDADVEPCAGLIEAAELHKKLIQEQPDEAEPPTQIRDEKND